MFDWKVGLFILQLLVLGGNIATFVIIKFNDLRHLGIAITEINKNIANLNTEFKKVSDKVIAIDTRCGERHKV